MEAIANSSEILSKIIFKTIETIKNCFEYLKILQSKDKDSLLRKNKDPLTVDMSSNSASNNFINLNYNINKYLKNDTKTMETPNITLNSSEISNCVCPKCNTERETNMADKSIIPPSFSNTANMTENSKETRNKIQNNNSNHDEYSDIEIEDDNNDITVLTNLQKFPEPKPKVITITSRDGNNFQASYFVERLIMKNSINKFNKQNFRKMYCCLLCPYKKNMLSHLKAHLQNHKFYKGSIKCRYCEYYAFNSFKLKQHEILHSDYKPQDSLVIKVNMHYCNLCPYKTVNINNLDKHLLRHNYQGPNHYKCRYCEYYLTKKTHLLSHEILHNEYQKE